MPLRLSSPEASNGTSPTIVTDEGSRCFGSRPETNPRSSDSVAEPFSANVTYERSSADPCPSSQTTVTEKATAPWLDRAASTSAGSTRTPPHLHLRVVATQVLERSVVTPTTHEVTRAIHPSPPHRVRIGNKALGSQSRGGSDVPPVPHSHRRGTVLPQRHPEPVGASDREQMLSYQGLECRQ